MENLRQVFINNLRRYRKAKKVRQLDLAVEIGKSPNYINSIENGKYFPPPETIERIADFLGVEPMLLFSRQSDEIPFSSRESSTEFAEVLYARLKADLHEILKKDIAAAISFTSKC